MSGSDPVFPSPSQKAGSKSPSSPRSTVFQSSKTLIVFKQSSSARTTLASLREASATFQQPPSFQRQVHFFHEKITESHRSFATAMRTRRKRIRIS